MRFSKWFMAFVEYFIIEFAIFSLIALWILIIGFTVGRQIEGDGDFWPAVSSIGSIGLLFVALLVRNDFRRKYKFSQKMDAAKDIYYKRNQYNLINYIGELTKLISFLQNIHEKKKLTGFPARNSIIKLKALQKNIIKYSNNFFDLKPDIAILFKEKPIQNSFNDAEKWVNEINTLFGTIIYFGSRSIDDPITVYDNLKTFLKEELTNRERATSKSWCLDKVIYGGLWGNMWDEAAQLGQALDKAALEIIQKS